MLATLEGRARFLLRRQRLFRLLNDAKRLGAKAAYSESPGFVSILLANGVELVGSTPSPSKLAYWRSVVKPQEVEEFGFSIETLELVQEASRYYIPRSLPASSLKDFGGTRRFLLDKEDPAVDFRIRRSDLNTMVTRLWPKPGDLCIDIGAMWGFGTLRLSELVGPSGKVFAFEADPRSFQVLSENMRRNGATNVVCLPYAATDQAKDESIFWTDDVPSGNSLHKEVLENREAGPLRGMSVRAVRADEVLRSFGVDQLNFASITVNGGEPEALAGLSSTIEKSPRFSISAAGWYERDGRLVADILEAELSRYKITSLYRGKKGRIAAWIGAPSTL